MYCCLHSAVVMNFSLELTTFTVLFLWKCLKLFFIAFEMKNACVWFSDQWNGIIVCVSVFVLLSMGNSLFLHALALTNSQWKWRTLVLILPNVCLRLHNATMHQKCSHHYKMLVHGSAILIWIVICTVFTTVINRQYRNNPNSVWQTHCSSCVWNCWRRRRRRKNTLTHCDTLLNGLYASHLRNGEKRNNYIYYYWHIIKMRANAHTFYSWWW